MSVESQQTLLAAAAVLERVAPFLPSEDRDHAANGIFLALLNEIDPLVGSGDE